MASAKDSRVLRRVVPLVQPRLSDPLRTYDGIWRLAHDWIRRRKDANNRRDALKDHFPNLPNQTKGGAGTGKGERGPPQVCHAWRNKGTCDKKDAGTCNYAHPESAKNIGKPASGKGKGKGKNASRQNSDSSRSSADDGDWTQSPSPPGKVVHDPKLLCQKFLKGKCNKGDACTYHHNGVCSFHKQGNCKRGDKCVFSHHDTTATIAVAASAEPKPPRAAAKAPAKGKATENS